MDVRTLIERLGGPSVVAERLGETAKTISMWGTRNSVPYAHHIALWRLAIDAKLDWTPPDADGLKLVPREAA
jgi:hypothetical protein